MVSLFKKTTDDFFNPYSSLGYKLVEVVLEEVFFEDDSFLFQIIVRGISGCCKMNREFADQDIALACLLDIIEMDDVNRIGLTDLGFNLVYK